MNPTLRCDPELLNKNLGGRTYIVTGANSGIGRATAEQLVRQGAHVVLAGRRIQAVEEVVDSIDSSSPKGSGEAMILDLGNLESVRNFATAFQSKNDALHGLVNNAGVMNTPRGTTADGFETQLGVNHLGHFLLTELLLDLLKQSAPSRIVVVSSAYHVKARGRIGEINFEDLHFERRDYDAWGAYAQSKLANVLHARELARRLEGSGVSAFSVHPGWVRTNLISNTMPRWVQDVLMRPLSGWLNMIDTDDGAQTTLHCLLADEAPGHSGAYFSQKGEYPAKGDRKGGWPMRSPNPYVEDDGVASRLYQVSRELVGL